MSSPQVQEVKHKYGTLAFECWDIDDINLTLKHKDPYARLADIKELEYKERDIIIASYPKTGTNWLKDSLWMLLTRSTHVALAGTMLDFFPSLDGYRKQGSRRIELTHLRPAYFSESHKGRAKFIFGVRDPKDAAVSIYHHFRKDVAIKLQATCDQFFALLAQGLVPYGGVFDFCRDWQTFIESNVGDVVYYEDMQCHKDYQ